MANPMDIDGKVECGITSTKDRFKVLIYLEKLPGPRPTPGPSRPTPGRPRPTPARRPTADLTDRPNLCFLFPAFASFLPLSRCSRVEFPEQRAPPSRL